MPAQSVDGVSSTLRVVWYGRGGNQGTLNRDTVGNLIHPVPWSTPTVLAPNQVARRPRIIKETQPDAPPPPSTSNMMLPLMGVGC